MRSDAKTFAFQREVHRDLGRFVNGQWIGRRGGLLVTPKQVRHKAHVYAAYLARRYRELSKALSSAALKRTALAKIVKEYRGRVECLLSLRDYLNEHIQMESVRVYVHGSLATGEEISYSDVDLLVVVRSSVLGNATRLAETALRLTQARRLIVRHDVLQHHGFFVLSEVEFDFYCNAYFPHVLFDHAKALLPHSEHTLRIRLRPSCGEEQESLARMLDAIEGKLRAGRYPRNYYELKLLLSQIMLVPSLYLQARGQPVFKRDSFELARSDFTPVEWRVVDVASQMRLEWDFRPNLLSRFLTRYWPSPFAVTIYQKKIGQPVSPKMGRYLTDSFYQGALRFVAAVRAKGLAGRERRS
ncbi:MAG TPA: nucleotidyltransferase domain-containing protein [Planctomycetes bacterium]|nr:nucleotidyltransferase domain-containing protein [Planctomycetota bacterium]